MFTRFLTRWSIVHCAVGVLVVFVAAYLDGLERDTESAVVYAANVSLFFIVVGMVLTLLVFQVVVLVPTFVVMQWFPRNQLPQRLSVAATTIALTVAYLAAFGVSQFSFYATEPIVGALLIVFLPPTDGRNSTEPTQIPS